MARKKYRIELGLIENWPDDTEDFIFWRTLRGERKIKANTTIFNQQWDLWQAEALIYGRLITIHGWCQAGSFPVDWHDYVE